MIAVDWISSLKQVSWMSSRNLADTSKNSGANPNTPMLARARRVQKLRAADDKDGGKKKGRKIKGTTMEI
jgi:hypothetical protein